MSCNSNKDQMEKPEIVNQGVNNMNQRRLNVSAGSGASLTDLMLCLGFTECRYCGGQFQDLQNLTMESCLRSQRPAVDSRRRWIVNNSSLPSPAYYLQKIETPRIEDVVASALQVCSLC